MYFWFAKLNYITVVIARNVFEINFLFLSSGGEGCVWLIQFKFIWWMEWGPIREFCILHNPGDVVFVYHCSAIIRANY